MISWVVISSNCAYGIGAYVHHNVDRLKVQCKSISLKNSAHLRTIQFQTEETQNLRDTVPKRSINIFPIRKTSSLSNPVEIPILEAGSGRKDESRELICLCTRHFQKYSFLVQIFLWSLHRGRQTRIMSYVHIWGTINTSFQTPRTSDFVISVSSIQTVRNISFAVVINEPHHSSFFCRNNWLSVLPH